MSSEGKFTVGVIGTQNTGKSTFIKDVIERFRGTPNEFRTVGCDYREKVRKAGLAINRNGNLASQNVILDTLVEQLDIIDTMPGGNYLTDRSPIDALVYTLYLHRHTPDSGITQADVEEQLAKVRKAVPRYDRIVFLDLDRCGNVKVVDDTFRDTNLEFRNEVDSLFKEAFKLVGEDLFKGRLVDGIEGTREERVEQFVRELGPLFHEPLHAFAKVV